MAIPSLVVTHGSTRVPMCAFVYVCMYTLLAKLVQIYNVRTFFHLFKSLLNQNDMVALPLN